MKLPVLSNFPTGLHSRFKEMRPFEDERWFIGKIDPTFPFGYVRSGFNVYNDEVLVPRDALITYDDDYAFVQYYGYPLSMKNGRLFVNYGWVAVEPEEFVEGPTRHGRFSSVILGRSALQNMYLTDGEGVAMSGDYYSIKWDGKEYFVTPMSQSVWYYSLPFDPQRMPFARMFGRY